MEFYISCGRFLNSFSAFILSNLIFKLFQFLKITLVILYVLLISQTFGRSIQENSEKKDLKWLKMNHNGFYWDTFSDGFGGGFQTMKKRGLQVNKNFNVHDLIFIYLYQDYIDYLHSIEGFNRAQSFHK